MQDLERHPQAALIIDLAGDPDEALKALERVKQSTPDLYIIASHYHADGDTVIGAMRAGANEFLVQPLKRTEFKDAMARFERAPKRTGTTESKLGKIHTFLGAKGGVGTTTLAVNFATVQSQRKKSTVVLDLDWAANDVAMQLGAAPQYTLAEVAENLARMDQALFEGFVTRDPLGMYIVGPPDTLEHRGFFTDSHLREFTTFLIEKYDDIVIDAGKNLNDEAVMSACQVSSTVFIVVQQDVPCIRNAQRYISAMVRMGFSQDQIRVVVNHYTKKIGPNHASLEQIQQTLNQPVFYGIPSSPAFLAAVNRARPLLSDRQAAPEVDRLFRAFVDKATGAKTPKPMPTSKTA
jgi:pilus assembly protein CpaE